ncbi:MAG: hypothetical protein AB7O38_14505, partial [Pirellulaceae bacterium]
SEKCNCHVVKSCWMTHGQGNVATGDVDSTVLFQGQWEANQTHRYAFELLTASWPPTYYGTYLNVSHFVQATVQIPWAVDPKASVEFPLIATSAPDDLKPTVAPAKSHSAIGWIIGGVLLAILGVAFGVLLLIIVPILAVAGGCFWFFRVFLPSQITGSMQCSVEPQRLASTDKVRGTMRFTPKRTVPINGIRCILTCVEKCVSGSGSNRKTHQHEVYRHVETLSEARTLQLGMAESFDFALPLPENAPYSLKLSDNELNWAAELRIDIPRWPDWVKSFPLTVVPGGEASEAAARALLAQGRLSDDGEDDDEYEGELVEAAAREQPVPSDNWFDEVMAQVVQSRRDPPRMQLVLDAVRDHAFSIRVDIDRPPHQPPAMAGGLQQGTWMTAHYRPRDLALCLLWTDGRQVPVPHTYDWSGQAQILGYDEGLDRLLMRVLPA